ncbi:SHD1 domain-containing protein [Lignipirellula cremea]|uniref:SLA1 homology domain-containing protein n=1 Tax=Lignipirellula cremea TaxID=2528010 RepID=A0A518DXS2_9BACT|nr:SHD1 domain-containing protein [Lignipirellula cremea]QDU96647.1 hypothetical protein Pla8534_44680 [Lignipirellula cremea]
MGAVWRPWIFLGCATVATIGCGERVDLVADGKPAKPAAEQAEPDAAPSEAEHLVNQQASDDDKLSPPPAPPLESSLTEDASAGQHQEPAAITNRTVAPGGPAMAATDTLPQPPAPPSGGDFGQDDNSFRVQPVPGGITDPPTTSGSGGGFAPLSGSAEAGASDTDPLGGPAAKPPLGDSSLPPMDFGKPGASAPVLGSPGSSAFGSEPAAGTPGLGAPDSAPDFGGPAISAPPTGPLQPGAAPLPAPGGAVKPSPFSPGSRFAPGGAEPGNAPGGDTFTPRTQFPALPPAGSPGGAASDREAPRFGAPGADVPSSPGVGSPAAETPGSFAPGAPDPGLDRPGMDPSSMSGPGVSPSPLGAPGSGLPAEGGPATDSQPRDDKPRDEWTAPGDAPAPVSAEREWWDRSGKFSMRAQLLEETDGHVRLVTADGKRLRIAFDKLSDRDQGFVAAITNPQAMNELRTWKDASGTYAIEGKHLSLADGSLRLEDSNGERFRVEVSQLSEFDQGFLEGMRE